MIQRTPWPTRTGRLLPPQMLSSRRAWLLETLASVMWPWRMESTRATIVYNSASNHQWHPLFHLWMGAVRRSMEPLNQRLQDSKGKITGTNIIKSLLPWEHSKWSMTHLWGSSRTWTHLRMVWITRVNSKTCPLTNTTSSITHMCCNLIRLTF